MRAPMIAACAVVAACTHIPVADLGDGRHSVTATSPSGGYSGSHEEVIEQANDYCHRWHQSAVLDVFQDQPGVGPRGEHTSSLVFRCAAPLVLHF
jgi:hypothetical protein